MLHFQTGSALLIAIDGALACMDTCLHCISAVSALRVLRRGCHAGGGAQRGDMVRI